VCSSSSASRVNERARGITAEHESNATVHQLFAPAGHIRRYRGCRIANTPKATHSRATAVSRTPPNAAPGSSGSRGPNLGPSAGRGSASYIRAGTPPGPGHPASAPSGAQPNRDLKRKHFRFREREAILLRYVGSSRPPRDPQSCLARRRDRRSCGPQAGAWLRGGRSLGCISQSASADARRGRRRSRGRAEKGGSRPRGHRRSRASVRSVHRAGCADRPRAHFGRPGSLRACAGEGPLRSTRRGS
jgi:hypothetical protein